MVAIRFNCADKPTRRELLCQINQQEWVVASHVEYFGGGRLGGNGSCLEDKSTCFYIGRLIVEETEAGSLRRTGGYEIDVPDRRHSAVRCCDISIARFEYSPVLLRLENTRFFTGRSGTNT